MSKRPWMPLYIGDYLGDTTHLSTAEHGCYLLLIMHYWEHGKLPCGDRALARIARVEPEWWSRSYRTVMQQFFTPEWKHKRIEIELKKVVSLKALKNSHFQHPKKPTWKRKSTNNINDPISHTTHSPRKKEKDARAREEKYHGKQKPSLRDAIGQLGPSAADDLRRADEEERRTQNLGADVVRLLPHRRRS